MTWRRGAYVVSGITVVGLIAELGWFVLDPKGDVRAYLLDQAARLVRIRPIP